jgi:hypothetical protein
MDDFSDLRQVVILIAMVGVFVLNSVLKPIFKELKKAQKNHDAPRNPEEEEVVYEEVQPLEEVRTIVESLSRKEKRSKKHASKKTQKAQSPTPPVTMDKGPTEAPSSPLRIRTKADARRAFLYSEIFNRKYE